MKDTIKIAIVGLGQVGNYLYNELKIKQKDIELKTGKKIKIVGISAKSKNKKRKFKIDKKIFYSNPIKIITKQNQIYYLKLLVSLMGFLKV
jgi:homoserine dehydrogenase